MPRLLASSLVVLVLTSALAAEPPKRKRYVDYTPAFTLHGHTSLVRSVRFSPSCP